MRLPALVRHLSPALVAAVVLSGLVVAAPASAANADAPVGVADQVTELPGFGPVTDQFAGYASVNAGQCATVLCDGPGEAGLFYWFAGKADGGYAKAPTIVWTNGGPGSSSFWGFFTENGPYAIAEDGTLAARPDAWNGRANFLMFDQPLGVGLSFASPDVEPVNLRQGVAQWYQALVNFLAKHPEVAANPIIVAGESYGGAFAPLLAQAILDGNEAAGRDLVTLDGLVLVAPWVDPLRQSKSLPEFAFARGLISSAEKARLDGVYERCAAAVRAQTPTSEEAWEICNEITDAVSRVGGRDLYDLVRNVPADPEPIEDYLDDPAVRAAIHARPTGEMSMISDSIYENYIVGMYDSTSGTVQNLLAEGVPVMVVSGLDDVICNFIGVGYWLDRLKGAAAQGFHAAGTTPWVVDDEVLGHIQDGGQLTWVKVFNAGHLVPADQPRVIDLVAERFLS